MFQGYILVREARVDEGLRLMDEGMTWALDGRLAPTSSAVIFCRTIDTCYGLGDYRRASEWMDAIADCFARTGIEAFPGDCEAHSVGILIGRGAWSEGERRARRACAAMEPMDLTHVGLALAEIAARYARPALAAAAECAQATVLSAEGDPATAAASLRRGIALWREAGAPYDTARARLLLGEALERHGDRRQALVEFDAARAAFETLGAELDLQRAAGLLASA